ncbi:MAG: ATP-binding protein, partial [Gilvibacter sp.]
IGDQVSSKNKAVYYPCVNLQDGKKQWLVDIDVLYNKDSITIAVFDFTEHYKRSHPIIQEKNETAIAAERLKFEKQLLEEKERLKNTFLAKLSHELRNPLSNMLGFVGLLRDSKTSYEQQEMLKIVDKTGRHLEELLNDLLDISKISEGNLELKKVPFKLEDVALHLKELFALKSRNQSVVLTISIKENVPKVVIGDPTRLRQILINLIENAYKSTRKGSVELTISLNYNRAKKATVNFCVEDTGHGIEETEIPKIFESYYQIESLLSQTQGEGLGLKIVHDLVLLQNGKIKVSSQVGEGSRFDVALPFDLPITKEKKGAKKAPIQTQKPIRVLLVDDAEIDQMLIMKILIKEGFIKMDLAINGQMAWQLLELKEYDVLLVDLDLPVMDGMTFIKKVRNQKMYKNLPIVILTAIATSDYKEAAAKLNVNEYITKPFDAKHLVESLSEAVK